MAEKISANELFRTVTADELREELVRLETNTRASGVVQPGTTDIHRYVDDMLARDYPGLRDHIRQEAAAFAQKGSNHSFVAGYLAGSMILAIELILSAETRDLPEL